MSNHYNPTDRELSFIAQFTNGYSRISPQFIHTPRSILQSGIDLYRDVFRDCFPELSTPTFSELGKSEFFLALCIGAALSTTPDNFDIPDDTDGGIA